jgi:hypothetical protein
MPVLPFSASRFSRRGSFRCAHPLERVFPLLCPKREEDWIPGWECETIFSLSGYNEPGAVFRTLRAYGTEIYWNTLEYDLATGTIDFLLFAPRLFNMRFAIHASGEGASTEVEFRQSFTGLSQEGNARIEESSKLDFAARLTDLGTQADHYLGKGNRLS